MEGYSEEYRNVQPPPDWESQGVPVDIPVGFTKKEEELLANLSSSYHFWTHLTQDDRALLDHVNACMTTDGRGAPYGYDLGRQFPLGEDEK
jgi:hypothetical protein